MTLKTNDLRQIYGSGRGLRHFPRFPRRSRFGPTQSQRQKRFARLRRLSLALLLSALPVTGAGGAFLPRQGLGVFRHAWVSEKRSQTLNSLGGKTLWQTRNPLMKSGSVASRLRFGKTIEFRQEKVAIRMALTVSMVKPLY